MGFLQSCKEKSHNLEGANLSDFIGYLSTTWEFGQLFGLYLMLGMKIQLFLKIHIDNL